MKIVFGNSKVRKQCGKASGKLKQRLDDILDADNMAVLSKLPGRLHALRENRKGQWALDLEHPTRLVIKPIGDPLPISKDGWLDMNKILAIEIIEIGDYHGK
jgi:proteic killer suppression protein